MVSEAMSRARSGCSRFGLARQVLGGLGSPRAPGSGALRDGLTRL